MTTARSWRVLILRRGHFAENEEENWRFDLKMAEKLDTLKFVLPFLSFFDPESFKSAAKYSPC